uniref:YbjQ family protein n=1 Tax=Desulfovibrio desulfuricans (strain ATCC 27774 / DSM 6949 / MB) TaxID=525146 RepID=B8IYM6_DESDA
MFFLLGGHEKKARKAEKQVRMSDANARVREVFMAGRFPVVTTHRVEGRRIAKVLGLVCCRGFDSDEAFFGMAARAMNKGAQAIVGYSENVAFHPDGSKYFSCFGTAVMFEYDPMDPEALPIMLQQKFRAQEQSSDLNEMI